MVNRQTGVDLEHRGPFFAPHNGYLTLKVLRSKPHFVEFMATTLSLWSFNYVRSVLPFQLIGFLPSQCPEVPHSSAAYARTLGFLTGRDACRIINKALVPK